MAPAYDDPSPHHQYGSVEDSKSRISQDDDLLPRSPSSRFAITASRYPAAVGGQQHPPQLKKTNLRDSDERRSISHRLAVTVVCGLAFAAGSAVSWSRSSASRSPSAMAGGFFEVKPNTATPAADIRPINSETSFVVAGDDADSIAPLEFTALNFYHVRDGKPGQDYPWLKDVKLIEPHRDTTLAVVGAKEGFEYRWEVRAGGLGGASAVGEMQATATGAVTIVVLTQLDEHIVVLEEVDGDGKVTNRLEETVMVKYVRREIRTLTADEKEELLDAMHLIWAVRGDDGTGIELYGEDYADIYAISRLHFKAASNGTCDHFHDGLGFLVSHSLITNTFEFSLQLINPKLTIPYWDFTIETTSSGKMVYDQKNPLTRTEMLSPEWFGSVDLEDNMVKDGRWANTPIPEVRENNPGLLEPNVYGRLRAPWNTNNNEYITRGVGKTCQFSADGYLSWPTCDTHYELITTNPDFYSWVWSSMGDAHTPVHLWLGGNMGCDDMYTQIGALVGDDIAETLAYLSIGHRKFLFCEKAWGCNRTASVEERPSELMSSGTCGCQGYDLTQGDDYKTVMDMLVFVEFFVGGFSEDIQRQVVQILCSGVVVFGEHSQSSSSLDPLFWPMHPTTDRLYQFSVLTGQVKDFNWPDKDTEVTLPDGTSYTQYVSSDSLECSGHHGSDIFPFGLLGSDIDGFKIKTAIRRNPAVGNILSNREVLEAFDPRANSMNYVYDHFKWDHCKSEGLDFNDVWSESPPSDRKKFFERDQPLSAVYTTFKREMADLMKEDVA